MLKFFVYGTLKPGEINYKLYCQGLVVEEKLALTKGLLFDLSLGYPAMMEGEGWIKGYLLTFKEKSILDTLDRLEDYQEKRSPSENEYYRKLIAIYNPELIEIGQAWGYFMNSEKIKQFQGIRLFSGCWKS
ncbi:MAG: gamma-glutamylcyclotransferase [Prochloraceae cyanobacterium]|nr:gamma-glutamylcyclotransferase [Prochloraceae cyanobacterium]